MLVIRKMDFELDTVVTYNIPLTGQSGTGVVVDIWPPNPVCAWCRYEVEDIDTDEIVLCQNASQMKKVEDAKLERLSQCLS